jgi:hypothetical protein
MQRAGGLLTEHCLLKHDQWNLFSIEVEAYIDSLWCMTCSKKLHDWGSKQDHGSTNGECTYYCKSIIIERMKIDHTKLAASLVTSKGHLLRILNVQYPSFYPLVAFIVGIYRCNRFSKIGYRIQVSPRTNGIGTEHTYL